MNFTIRDTVRERFKSHKETWAWSYHFTYDTDDMQNCVADLVVYSDQMPSKDEVKKAILENYKLRVLDRDTKALKEIAAKEVRDLYAFCFEG